MLNWNHELVKTLPPLDQNILSKSFRNRRCSQSQHKLLVSISVLSHNGLLSYHLQCIAHNSKHIVFRSQFFKFWYKILLAGLKGALTLGFPKSDRSFHLHLTLFYHFVISWYSPKGFHIWRLLISLYIFVIHW